MSRACCACHACQCDCHLHLSEAEYARLTQDVLRGERLDVVAARWHVSANRIRDIVKATCAAANPTQYACDSWGGGKVLDKLRLSADVYGFLLGPKYVARQRRHQETVP
jgi:hypothetical protein